MDRARAESLKHKVCIWQTKPAAIADNLNVNLSISKSFPLKESRTLELRATAHNVLNIVRYSGVNTQVESTTFGYVDAAQPMR